MKAIEKIVAAAEIPGVTAVLDADARKRVQDTVRDLDTLAADCRAAPLSVAAGII